MLSLFFRDNVSYSEQNIGSLYHIVNIMKRTIILAALMVLGACTKVEVTSVEGFADEVIECKSIRHSLGICNSVSVLDLDGVEFAVADTVFGVSTDTVFTQVSKGIVDVVVFGYWDVDSVRQVRVVTDRVIEAYKLLGLTPIGFDVDVEDWSDVVVEQVN